MGPFACSILLHFIRIYTVCKGKKNLQMKEYNIYCLNYNPTIFVCFDSLHPSQQFLSYVGTGLPGLNQY